MLNKTCLLKIDNFKCINVSVVSYLLVLKYNHNDVSLKTKISDISSNVYAKMPDTLFGRSEI